LLLFGPGRIAKIAGEIGSGIRNFRKNLDGENTENNTEEKKTDETTKTDK
jgi:Sec-independent protein translocase protein TatA